MGAINNTKPTAWPPVIAVDGIAAGQEVIDPVNVRLEVGRAVRVGAFHIFNC